jgi:aminoglycoside phosphotransferase (APT) family kinase protein
MGAVRPAAVLGEGSALVYRRVRGSPLTAHLRRQGPALGGHLASAGVALRALHEAPPELTDGLGTRTLGAELASVVRAGEHLLPLLPSARSHLRSLFERAGDLDDQLAREPPVLVHGDYRADHLWVRPGGLDVADLDRCALAEPALDLGTLLADLRWWYAVSGRAGLAGAQARVLQGYRVDTAAPERLQRARLWEAILLVKLTVRRVRLFDRFWRSRTEALVLRAEAVLEGLEADVGNPHQRA